MARTSSRSRRRRAARPERRLALLAVLAVALGAATASVPASGAVAPAASSAGQATAARTTAVARDVRALAVAVHRGSVPARQRALLRVMQHLQFRTYSARGKLLVRGARGLPKRFYLYDVELRALAQALARRERSSLGEVALRLQRLGVARRGRPLSAEAVRGALVSVVRRAAARPRDPGSTIPLLVRELGRRQRPAYDLARNPPAARIRLDPLQTLLVTADVLLGAAQRGSGRTLSSAAAPCVDDPGTTSKGIKAARFLGGFLKKVGGPVKIVGGGLDLIHGSVLAFSVRVRSLSPESQETHYGPAGHRGAAGKEIRFRVLVEMLDDLGEATISCGALAGMHFPKKGPIPGVRIFWEQAEGKLADHGSVSFDPADGRTGRDGVGALVFRPKDETGFGVGMEKSERGVVNGVALYQSAFGNLPGTIAQVLTPKYAGGAWTVAFHDAKLVLDVDASFKEETEMEPVTARVRIQGLELGRAADGSATGEKGLEVASYHVADWQCWTHTWSVQPSAPFRVTSFTPGFSQPPGGALTANPVLVFEPGALSETVTHYCEGESYPDQRGAYQAAMQVLVPGGHVDGWQYVGGNDVWARKTISGGGGGYSGTVTFELRLAPGG